VKQIAEEQQTARLIQIGHLTPDGELTPEFTLPLILPTTVTEENNGLKLRRN